MASSPSPPFAPPLFPSQLNPARLVQRYKRFLADVVIDETGEETTVHCPNPGAMMGLKAPGSKVWLSRSSSKTRKLPLTLELVEADGTLVGINTNLPNKLAEEAIAAGLVPALSGLGALRREVKYGINSRIDLLGEEPGGRLVHIEVKNVHLMREPGLAEFPDCVTLRGAKHLRELGDQVEAGHRAVMLYIVQRGDCDRVAFAADLDPGYAAAFTAARARGVEAYGVRCDISPDMITPSVAIPICDPAGPVPPRNPASDAP
ncbi:DNA/RNA nuclease SfsA [Fulvimarina sp. 2208YS6-2-32]|uniref:Sugar fermentation stimulation protein homolog n=1 Tax=Fulvimarina uroteuthidis TaxID=3098149 RepID=A0ABU5I4H8_9HYPH|nr:DNA/RNA nuclease SfsA [Fulvimarina sp. 2208YS6-2-32]MDY8109658.1 DNA/RNA nuclease SfsA [Fulvimarina sp. 2208YS6-2-32]